MDDALILEVPDAELSYRGSAEHYMGTLLPQLECADATAAELAVRANVPWKSMEALLHPACDAGAVWDASGLFETDDLNRQLDTYYFLCDSWARDVFIAPFWTLVLSGKASTDLVLGWCEQFYHRTVGADEHNALAVAHCTIEIVRELLDHHFGEECGHGEIFLRGLDAAGVPRARVQATPALSSTRQLIDYMSDLGCQDTLAYLACYGVLHSPRQGQTLERVRDQFAALGRLYPAAAPAICAVAEHAEIDVAAGHDQIVFEKYLQHRGYLAPSEASRTLRSARGTVKAFNGFFAGILERYGRKDEGL